MRTYELFLILDSKKDDASAQKIIRDIEAILTKCDAKIVKNHGGHNARLAYQINKKRETYQVTLEIEARPDTIVEIKRNLTLLESILRFTFFTLATANS